MATTLYLPSTSLATGISPAIALANQTTSFIRRIPTLSAGSTAMTKLSDTNSETQLATYECYQAVIQFSGAFSVSGTVSAAIWGISGAAPSSQVNGGISIRVIAADGTTVRGTALTPTAGSFAGSTTTGESGFLNAVALTTVAASATDYLVIDIGWADGSPTGAWNPVAGMQFGNNGASNYGYTVADTSSVKNPTIQFSADLPLVTPTTGLPNSLMLLGCGT